MALADSPRPTDDPPSSGGLQPLRCSPQPPPLLPQSHPLVASAGYSHRFYCGAGPVRRTPLGGCSHEHECTAAGANRRLDLFCPMAPPERSIDGSMPLAPTPTSGGSDNDDAYNNGSNNDYNGYGHCEDNDDDYDDHSNAPSGYEALLRRWERRGADEEDSDQGSDEDVNESANDDTDADADAPTNGRSISPMLPPPPRPPFELFSEEHHQYQLRLMAHLRRSVEERFVRSAGNMSARARRSSGRGRRRGVRGISTAGAGAGNGPPSGSYSYPPASQSSQAAVTAPISPVPAPRRYPPVWSKNILRPGMAPPGVLGNSGRLSPVRTEANTATIAPPPPPPTSRVGAYLTRIPSPALSLVSLPSIHSDRDDDYCNDREDDDDDYRNDNNSGDDNDDSDSNDHTGHSTSPFWRNRFSSHTDWRSTPLLSRRSVSGIGSYTQMQQQQQQQQWWQRHTP